MLSADSTTPLAAAQMPFDDDDGPAVGLTDILTWLGERKRLIALVPLAAALVSLAVALLLPPIYTARTT
ncbi:MAG: Wzz/FepE/Etk N-terminal domain-containing protein, partial [Caldimonas sp.]